jgi:hypothetical protein
MNDHSPLLDKIARCHRTHQAAKDALRDAEQAERAASIALQDAWGEARRYQDELVAGRLADYAEQPQ